MTRRTGTRQGQQALSDAFLKLENRSEAAKFLADLCTPAELTALAERWSVARLVDAGKMTYREINAYTGVSTATIVRVARFLRDESNQGYRLILDRTEG